MTTTTDLDGLASLWRHFAESETAGYSPLYNAIARSVAEDETMLALVAEAPPHGHLPIMLMASAHHLLLGGTEHPLADVYAGLAPVEDAPARFREFCVLHRDALLALLLTKRVQTNECGRSALIALALARVADELGPPAVLLDAGASAGLNLLYDRYHLDYRPHGALGDRSSPVHIRCEIVGTVDPMPAELPDVPVRLGLDRAPVDVTNADEARWLLACTWPDTGRLERTAAALRIAAVDPPLVMTGDVSTDIPAALEGTGDDLAVVVTSWVVGYLTLEKRAELIDSLRIAAQRRPVVWLPFEQAGVVDLFEQPSLAARRDIEPSVVGMVTFGTGADVARALALAHPHGAWMQWV